MSFPIYYVDRRTQKKEQELVYGDRALNFLYGGSRMGKVMAFLSARVPFFSRLYGFWQKTPFTKQNIRPFIKKYRVDEREFLLNVDQFGSFNDFFIRKLKPEARPLALGDEIAVIPADGRFLFFPHLDSSPTFSIKGQRFSLDLLLQDRLLAKRYEKGSMVMGRLCPTDYHRFHFPLHCKPGKARLINGPLYSVNPLAVKQNLAYLIQNKRMVTELETREFGKVLFIEIGATNVGSIIQTFVPGTNYQKGDEKGFFSFGGSALVILFEQNCISFDKDLLQASSENIEILCLMGQSMGKAI